ncbi:hypothetical protein [Kitasatospora sp. MBT66]|uniref:hypothetical protein n=1 Tax=Kitasatospora sp. MBT66 TaxID=1444769 RepID=UPI0005BD6AB3|nr:hypothetical protein [Kitasatospora sp. MBT66]
MTRNGSDSRKQRARELMRPDFPYSEALQLRDRRRAASPARQHLGCVVQFDGRQGADVVVDLAAALALDGLRVLAVHTVRPGVLFGGRGARRRPEPEAPPVSAITERSVPGRGALHEVTVTTRPFASGAPDPVRALVEEARSRYDYVLARSHTVPYDALERRDLLVGLVNQEHLPVSQLMMTVKDGKPCQIEAPLTPAQSIALMQHERASLFGWSPQPPSALILTKYRGLDTLPAEFRAAVGYELEAAGTPVLGDLEELARATRTPVPEVVLDDPDSEGAARFRATARALHTLARGRAVPAARPAPRPGSCAGVVVGLLPMQRADVATVAASLGRALVERGLKVLVVDDGTRAPLAGEPVPDWPAPPAAAALATAGGPHPRGDDLDAAFARARAGFDIVLLFNRATDGSAPYRMNGRVDTHLVIAQDDDLPLVERIADTRLSGQHRVHSWLDRHYRSQGRDRSGPSAAAFVDSVTEAGRRLWGELWGAASTWQPLEDFGPRQVATRTRTLPPAAAAAVLRERFVHPAGGVMPIAIAGLVLLSATAPPEQWLSAVAAEMAAARTPLLGLVPTGPDAGGDTAMSTVATALETALLTAGGPEGR